MGLCSRLGGLLSSWLLRPCPMGVGPAPVSWVPPVDVLRVQQQAFRTVSAAIQASCGTGVQRTDPGVKAAGPEGSASWCARPAGLPLLWELGVLSGGGRGLLLRRPGASPQAGSQVGCCLQGEGWRPGL